jgi:hypothetical protein
MGRVVGWGGGGGTDTSGRSVQAVTPVPPGTQVMCPGAAFVTDEPHAGFSAFFFKAARAFSSTTLSHLVIRYVPYP